MARRLSGAAEAVRFSLGSCVASGGVTLAVVVRRSAAATWYSLLGGFTSAGAAGPALEVDGTIAPNKPAYSPHTGGSSGGTALSSTLTDWMLVAVTVPGPASNAGTVYTANVTTGAAIASGTTNNGTQSTPISFIEAGCWESLSGVGTGQDDLNGWLAVAGWWNSVLTSAQIDALRTNKATSDWINHAVAPAAVWQFDGSVATAIQDLTGNGANQSSIAGTTQDTAADPPGWAYSGAGAAAASNSGLRRFPLGV